MENTNTKIITVSFMVTGILAGVVVFVLIDSMAASLAESQVRNYQRWPILNEYVWPNQYIGGTYAAEVAWFKNWIIRRADWMDSRMPGSVVTDPITGIDDEFINAGLSIYPNPGNDTFTFEWKNVSGQPCELKIQTVLGQEIYSAQHTGVSPLVWRSETSAGSLAQRGMYIVTVKNADGDRIVAKLIIE